MSDIVKKYQHYFNESVKLQEMVNEQLAYIAELEEALEELMEVYRITPKRRQVLDAIQDKADDEAITAAGPDGDDFSAKATKTIDRANTRSSRVDLIKMLGQPADKRKFDAHPTLKYFPDDQVKPKTTLGDKALKRDLAQARETEKSLAPKKRK
jgi:hypothetical protein